MNYRKTITEQKDKSIGDFLGKLDMLSNYWADLPNKTNKERLDGFAFSLLVLLDGGDCDKLKGYTLTDNETGEEVTNGFLHEVRGQFLDGRTKEGMTCLGDRNATLLIDAVKTCGTYDPSEVLIYCGENLYMHEYDTIVDFLEWVNDGHLQGEERRFGSANYEERFKEFLDSQE